MSWRSVVISKRAKLELKMDYLVVRDEKEIQRVHLSEIAVLMIENTAVSLTAGLVAELAERKEYSRFRKFLIKNGFIMLQNSVYCKLALNTTVSDAIMNKVRESSPKKVLFR